MSSSNSPTASAHVYNLADCVAFRDTETLFDDIALMEPGLTRMLSVTCLRPPPFNAKTARAVQAWRPAWLRSLPRSEFQLSLIEGIDDDSSGTSVVVSFLDIQRCWGIFYRSPIIAKLPISPCPFHVNGRSDSDVEVQVGLILRESNYTGMDDP
eukprot:CAMPEP_0197727504 /NCGR_PEP_ID=MMETSP1434-20131217/20798_1 /TAXON_ID=265543 /ORGANISM="Minutocellus polymorphus, Strain CCMP3303" /LENGTH=153 /DNA_ID=CAMNT_0043313715 /DNA_START=143 /DNA_END=601 /DNA_ORIENTATION=-